MIFMMRHGPTDKAPGVWLGRLDLPLSKDGRLAAERCAPGLARLKIDRVLSSPLKRSQQTAQVIATSLGLPLDLHPDLVEMDLGDATGHPPDETAALFPDAWAHYLADTVHHPVPGGETFHELEMRMVNLGDELETKGGRPLLVTHTGPILALVCRALHLDAHARVRLHPKPLAVSSLTLDMGGHLYSFNENAGRLP